MALFSPYDIWQMENYQGLGNQAPGGWAGQGGYLGPTPQGGFAPAPQDAYADASGNAPDAAPISGGVGAPAFTPAPMQPGPAAPAAPAMPQAPGLGGIGAQSMIGLGMGLLAATPFNRMGRALEGYQAGAQADLARQQTLYKAQQDAIANAYRERQMRLAEAPQIVDMGTDLYTGRKIFGFRSPGSTQITPATGAVQGGTSEISRVQPEYNEQGKDEAFMAALQKEDPITAKAVQDITEGRVPASGRNLQKLIPLASRYDQNFTGAQDYQTRLATAKSFAAGKDAQVVKNYNQALTHAENLWNLIPKVAMSDVGGPIGGIYNVGAGTVASAWNKQYQSDRAEYDSLAQKLGQEMTNAARIGGGSVSEVNHSLAQLQSAKSGPEMRGAIKGAIDWLDGAMQATAQKKSEGMKSQFAPSSLLSEKNQGTFDRIQSHVEGQSQNPPVATQTAPQPPAATAPQAPVRIPAGAIDAVRKNPNLRDQFERKYGPGSSDRFLSMDYNPNAS